MNSGPGPDAIPSSPGNWSYWSITLDFTSKAVADYRIVAQASDNVGNQNWDEEHIKHSFYDDLSGTLYLLARGDIWPNGKWYGLWDGDGVFGKHAVDVIYLSKFLFSSHLNRLGKEM